MSTCADLWSSFPLCDRYPSLPPSLNRDIQRRLLWEHHEYDLALFHKYMYLMCDCVPSGRTGTDARLVPRHFVIVPAVYGRVGFEVPCCEDSDHQVAS